MNQAKINLHKSNDVVRVDDGQLLISQTVCSGVEDGVGSVELVDCVVS